MANLEGGGRFRCGVFDSKGRCVGLQHRIGVMKKLSSSCKSTLLRLLQSELSFLNRLSSSHHHSPLSVNVGHLEAVVGVLEQPSITGVSRVCKSIPSSSAEKGTSDASSRPKSIYIDIVCSLNGRPVWIVVSARNSKYVTWDGSSGNKGLKMRIEQVLGAAKSCTSLRPSSVILLFTNGLDHNVNQKLREQLGAIDLEDFSCQGFDCMFFEENVEDEWVDVLPKSYEKACLLEIKVDCSSEEILSKREYATQSKLENLPLPVNDADANLNLGDSLVSLVSAMRCDTSDADPGISGLVNFDTTALIAIVSGISNGGIDKLLGTSENQLRSRFKGNYDFVIAQVNSEIQNPIHVELASVLYGKRGIICQSVYSEVCELVSMCGGPNEKFRANHFLKHLKLVCDSPSIRMTNLPTTRKLALKNKVVFGTGDCWQAPTLTANMAFVRAVAQTGLSMSTIEHRPRALIGD
ncbi:hypothetical protein LIER_08106 [Lithospermum erythrorhizon]|uniref:DUF1308 domain-containing protein n=1 Tax=Lithospermum erythrorhizon TaxID=34254 RepID=A0AAV3PCQ4_LITER